MLAFVGALAALVAWAGLLFAAESPVARWSPFIVWPLRMVGLFTAPALGLFLLWPAIYLAERQ